MPEALNLSFTSSIFPFETIFARRESVDSKDLNVIGKNDQELIIPFPD